MELHGTLDLDKIPWNSMELNIFYVLLLKFYGILRSAASKWIFLTYIAGDS